MSVPESYGFKHSSFISIDYSLPLRFWSNAIKHPDYIFDIRPSRSVDASLDVIGQLFHDAHDTKTHKLGQVRKIKDMSPLNIKVIIL